METGKSYNASEVSGADALRKNYYEQPDSIQSSEVDNTIEVMRRKQKQKEIEILELEYELAQAEAELEDSEDDMGNANLDLERKSVAIKSPDLQQSNIKLMSKVGQSSSN